MDELNEYCGVFGIYGHPEAAKITALGLYALQHRGQESAGIISSDRVNLHPEIHEGLVIDEFLADKEKCKRRFEKLIGDIAIGHTRYSTTGESNEKNAQPIKRGSIAIAHNGNLRDIDELKKRFENRLTTDSDTELILCFMEEQKNLERLLDTSDSQKSDLPGLLSNALQDLKGAYSLVMMSKNKLIGVRDPYGFRPLMLGKLGGAYVLASENYAFDLIEADYIREIKPGEMIVIDESGVNSKKILESNRLAHCIFELIYFSRPDSTLFGENVYLFRKELGRQLARESCVDADLVIPVPSSGIQGALGFSEESGIPYEPAIIRSHYYGRSFIEPSQKIRDFGIKLKLNALRELINGRRIIIVDDSIVRANTIKKIVRLLKKKCGAKEVHPHILSPRMEGSCFFGVDTPTQRELIASHKTNEQIAEFIGADSLHYLSLEGLLSCVREKDKYCLACFNRDYPI